MSLQTGKTSSKNFVGYNDSFKKSPKQNQSSIKRKRACSTPSLPTGMGIIMQRMMVQSPCEGWTTTIRFGFILIRWSLPQNEWHGNSLPEIRWYIFQTSESMTVITRVGFISSQMGLMLIKNGNWLEISGTTQEVGLYGSKWVRATTIWLEVVPWKLTKWLWWKPAILCGLWWALPKKRKIWMSAGSAGEMVNAISLIIEKNKGTEHAKKAIDSEPMNVSMIGKRLLMRTRWMVHCSFRL